MTALIIVVYLLHILSKAGIRGENTFIIRKSTVDRFKLVAFRNVSIIQVKGYGFVEKIDGVGKCASEIISIRIHSERPSKSWATYEGKWTQGIIYFRWINTIDPDLFSYCESVMIINMADSFTLCGGNQGHSIV